MSTPQQEPAPENTIDPQVVANYLRRYPEFFAGQRQLLAELSVPHVGADGTTSLIERQVSVLREQNRELKRQLHALVQVARENDRVTERMQRLTLALLETGSLNDALQALHSTLHEDFGADLVSLVLFVRPQAQAFDGANLHLRLDAGGVQAQEFEHLIKAGKPQCGYLRRALREYLFQERTGEVACAVALPLTSGSVMGVHSCVGVLGIGSHDPQRYHAGMGTLFLTHMGEVIGRTLRRWLADQHG